MNLTENFTLQIYTLLYLVLQKNQSITAVMKGDCACMDNEDEDGDEEGQEAEQDELIYEVS